MRSERRRILVGLVFAVLLTVLAFVSGGCAADTYTVCPGGGCDFESIQAAVDAAQPGDTIEVHSGTYYENVNVDEQLILRGVDTGDGKPIVNAGDIERAITLFQDGIVLDGFTATNANIYWGVGISVYSNNNTIINNTVSNNCCDGVSLFYSSGNTIADNTMVGNGIIIRGYELQHWNTHSIETSNTVNGKPVYYWKDQVGGTVPLGGGQVILANCTNVDVKNQNVSDGSVGISLGFSKNNALTGNTASDNSY